MTRAKQLEELVSLNPYIPWALTAMIGLPCTARMTAIGGPYANVLLCDIQL